MRLVAQIALWPFDIVFGCRIFCHYLRSFALCYSLNGALFQSMNQQK